MPAPGPVRVRFAPSPTGTLHLGNARTALFNWLFAARAGGTFVLRVEDTDAERSRPEHEAAIQEDLAWLGLRWQEGPDVGGPHGPYRQSERGAGYLAAAERLLAAGAAYPCLCDAGALEERRREAERLGRPFRYDGRCRDRRRETLPPGAPFALRLRLPDDEVRFADRVYGEVGFAPSQYGDPILRRSDGSPAYNFAAVVDDAAMAITHVLRGEDHLTNTGIQILLYRALGWEPPEFGHLPMILGPDGSRLSKRHGAASIGDLRRAGYLPEAVVNALALLGWSHPEAREVLTIDELAQAFDLGRVSRAAATFDPVKLAWFNGQWLRRLPEERLARETVPWLRATGTLPAAPAGDAAEWLGRALALFVGGADTLPALAERAALLFRFDPAERLADPEVQAILAEPGAGPVSEALRTLLSAAPGEGAALPGGFPGIRDEVRLRTGLKGKALFHALRALLTGHASGPELDRLVPILEEGSRLPLPRPVAGPAMRARAILALRAQAHG